MILLPNVLQMPPLKNSVAFQMREGYMFEKTSFKNVDLKGGKYWGYIIYQAIYKCLLNFTA